MIKLFGLIIAGVVVVMMIALFIKLMIWEWKTDKEIEELEEELNQRYEQQRKEEQELYEELTNLTPRQRKKLGKQIIDLMIKELESK